VETKESHARKPASPSKDSWVQNVNRDSRGKNGLLPRKPHAETPGIKTGHRNLKPVNPGSCSEGGRGLVSGNAERDLGGAGLREKGGPEAFHRYARFRTRKKRPLVHRMKKATPKSPLRGGAGITAISIGESLGGVAEEKRVATFLQPKRDAPKGPRRPEADLGSWKNESTRNRSIFLEREGAAPTVNVL